MQKQLFRWPEVTPSFNYTAADKQKELYVFPENLQTIRRLFTCPKPTKYQLIEPYRGQPTGLPESVTDVKLCKWRLVMVLLEIHKFIATNFGAAP